MPTKIVPCKIDQRTIDKYTKEQRILGARITLADQVCSGLKLAINNQSASWTYAYRKRGYMDGGKRHPQRTMKLGDPSTMSPSEARLAAEQIKAAVRSGRDPAVEERKATAARQLQEARKKSNLAWLTTYSTEQMADGATKYQRDEVRNVKLALEELAICQFYPEEITPKHLRNLVDLHRDRPATGRQRFGAFSRFLDYLLDEEVIDANPVLSVSKRSRPKTPPPRKTYYTPEQLAQLW
ncbi:MAG TPA: integrase arm-type DNA-binding domain-containing protein, partial [Roseovarius sp.]|nr:integrase arm-type DNA-binding domain-containing protein [Roseovarius sp.]